LTTKTIIHQHLLYTYACSVYTKDAKLKSCDFISLVFLQLFPVAAFSKFMGSKHLRQENFLVVILLFANSKEL